MRAWACRLQRRSYRSSLMWVPVGPASVAASEARRRLPPLRLGPRPTSVAKVTWLTIFSSLQGETSVKILTSVREKDVFIIQSGSPTINDTIMELLIMISACKGGSATKITGQFPPPPFGPHRPVDSPFC